VARIPKIFTSSDEPISDGRRIFNRVFAAIFIFMGGAGLLFAIGSLIFNSSLFVPQSADGVLKSIEVADNYDWSSETVRLFKPIPEAAAVRQDAVRGVVVDTKNNKFVVIAVGVEPQGVIYTSDGRFTARLDQARANEDVQSWDLVTDICNQDPAISAQAVTMPSPEDLLAGDPQLDSDQGTVFGQRAWRLSFKMTPTIASKLLLLDFFTKATAGRSNAEWVISESERQAIENGEFKTVSALAWVNRSGDRQIQQIDARIALDNGNRYRFLAQQTADGGDSSLAELDHGDPGCDLR
jgi:hypothetical protein